MPGTPAFEAEAAKCSGGNTSSWRLRLYRSVMTGRCQKTGALPINGKSRGAAGRGDWKANCPKGLMPLQHFSYASGG
jgi:hypothetical protein